jgi:hypothetical protein
MGRIFWDRFARFFAFWLIVAAIAGAVFAAWSPLPARTLAGIVAEGFRGDLARISTESFAFAAAEALASFAFGLLAAFGVLHALAASVSIGRARAFIQGYPSQFAFANDISAVRKRMEAHPLLGQAWKRFYGSVIAEGKPIRSTQRPQSFFTYPMLREQLIGLKIMPSVPNYFVGAGLLLTFIGLVIALYKAAEGTQAAQLAAAGSGAAAMQSALRDLLHAATFKFSTSIAGLSASIVLAFAFRLYAIRIEASLCDFCEALDSKLQYVSAHAISVEMRDSLAGQLSELKEINSEAFFARLGKDAAPAFDAALASALSPLTQEIRVAVDRLGQNSQEGVQDLLKKFSETLKSGAGAELRELAGSLQAVLKAMEGVRSDMAHSGEAFAAKLGEAAQNLNDALAAAGDNIGKQSEASRQTLDAMASSMQAVFDQAQMHVNANLSSAAESASLKLAEAMDRVGTKLETQAGGLQESLGGFKESSAGYFAEIGRQMSEAQERGARAVAEASIRTAAALEEGLAAAVKSIRREVEELAGVLRTSSNALGAQAEAIDKTVLRTRMTANAFEKCAATVNASIDPVTRSNEKMAEIAHAVGDAFQKASASLDEGQKATRSLSLAIASQIERLTKLWENYEGRFSKVDEDLQRAFEKLAQETTKQSQLLAEQTTRIDKGLAGAVDKLAGPVQGIGDGAQEISEAIGDLKKLFDKMKAAA